jgi:hypothetical protein
VAVLHAARANAAPPAEWTIIDAGTPDGALAEARKAVGSGS